MDDELSKIDLTPICIDVWLSHYGPAYSGMNVNQDAVAKAHASLGKFAEKYRRKGVPEDAIETAVRRAVSVASRKFRESIEASVRASLAASIVAGPTDTIN